MELHKQSKGKVNRVVLIIVALLVVAALVVLVLFLVKRTNKDEGSDGDTTTSQEVSGIEFFGEPQLVQGDEPHLASVVTGVIQNVSDEDISDIRVAFKATGADDEDMGTCTADITLTIAAGSDASFQATCEDVNTEDKVQNIEFKGFEYLRTQ
jgi:hypothetical protein